MQPYMHVYLDTSRFFTHVHATLVSLASQVVYGVHSVPARGVPRPTRNAAQLPNDDCRPYGQVNGEYYPVLPLLPGYVHEMPGRHFTS